MIKVFPGETPPGPAASVLTIRIKQIASEEVLNAPFIHRSAASAGTAKSLAGNRLP
jgi:hypothetical protein